jgi:hypothetical protein
LLIGTQWFDDRIVTPTVRDLVKTYATPYYQKLINRALGDDLKEYHCHIADPAAFPKLAETGPSTGIPFGPALAAHRDAWQARKQDDILRDLARVFKSKDGKKATPEELLALAELIKRSNKTPEEIKAMLLPTRDPASGKLDVQQAKTNVESGQPAVAKTKTRHIDYPKATKANLAYQKALHWDPLTFYAKPGVPVDSEEFADAVYDLQEAIHVHADGMLGDETLTAFYDRNKLKRDAAYAAAQREQERRRQAREAAEQARAERARIEAAKRRKDKGAGVPVAIPLPRRPASSPTVTGSMLAGTLMYGFPFATVDPPLTGKELAGATLSIDAAYRVNNEWAWFVGIPVTYESVGLFRNQKLLSINQADDFFFHVPPDTVTTYELEKGKKGFFLLEP